jgi:hypothetical protein
MSILVPTGSTDSLLSNLFVWCNQAREIPLMGDPYITNCFRQLAGLNEINRRPFKMFHKVNPIRIYFWEIL